MKEKISEGVMWPDRERVVSLEAGKDVWAFEKGAWQAVNVKRVRSKLKCNLVGNLGVGGSRMASIVLGFPRNPSPSKRLLCLSLISPQSDSEDLVVDLAVMSIHADRCEHIPHGSTWQFLTPCWICVLLVCSEQGLTMTSMVFAQMHM